MKLFHWLVAMLRESRGARGQLAFFTACIAIGVAAVVGIAALGGAIEDGLRQNARDLLAADMVVSSRRPLDPEVEKLVRDAGAADLTYVREFATMVAPVDAKGAAGASRIARLKMVRGRFPFYGEFVLDPPGELSAALEKGIVVAPELGVGVGERVRIGKTVHEVAAIVTKFPQQIGFMSMMGSRIYAREADLLRSGLLGFGSRVRHELLAEMPDVDAEALRERMRKEAKGAEYLRIETWRDGQPRMQRAIDNIERYLGLVALLSLILGGIGVAQIVRSWIASRTPSIAILRCLGMRPKEILTLFLGQVVLISVIGSLLGASIGGLLPVAFAELGPAFLSPEIMGASVFQPAAILRGVLLGVAIALLFSLPALTAVWRVSPAKVLRADAEPLPPPRLVMVASFVTLLLGVLGVAWFQSGQFLVAMWFTLGFAALVVTLVGGAFLMMRLAGRIPRGRMHPYLAQGITALARPGAGTAGGVVALGLGVTVVASMLIIEREMSANFATMIPDDAPTVFLVDVQPDQWKGVDEQLRQHGGTHVESQPVTMGRLAAINGRSVREIARERGGDRALWTLTREQRLAPLDQVPEGNRVISGEFQARPDVVEISLEQRYAKDMGVELGDRLTFDVQGLPIEFTLTSIRDVDWRSFSLNFFLIVEPEALAGAPGFRLAAARVPEAREQPLQDALAATYPNISVIKTRSLIDQIAALLGQLAIGVRVLGIFTVFSGLVILAGAIGAATMRRRREAALLKTLGATRRGVGALFLTEYGLLGAVAGLLGALGALALAWGFLDWFAELGFGWPLWVIPVAMVAAALLAAGCGVLASLRALRAPARESLQV